ncbi:MAG: type II secretion system protein N [Pseudomonadota bacterium]
MTAFLVTLLALAAAGLAGDRFWRLWTVPQAGGQAVLARSVDTPAPDGTAPAQVPPHRWRPVFGEVQPPAPPEPPAPPAPAPEPQPPAPPAPPIESLGFTLKGVVRAGDAVWGLVSHPTGERVVRVGDELADAVTVARIDEQGLWVDNGGDAPVLLGFADAAQTGSGFDD